MEAEGACTLNGLNIRSGSDLAPVHRYSAAQKSCWTRDVGTSSSSSLLSSVSSATATTVSATTAASAASAAVTSPSLSAPAKEIEEQKLLVLGGHQHLPDGKILAHDSIWSIPLDNNKQDCALCHNKMKTCNICHRKLHASRICHAPVCADSIGYSVCTKDDSIIVTGGISESRGSPVYKIEMFCFSTLSWRSLTSINSVLECRGAHASTCVGDKLYLISGLSNLKNKGGWVGRLTSSVIMLDLKSLSWSQCYGIPKACTWPGCAVVGRHIFIIGGFSWCNEEEELSDVFKYNTETDNWTKCEPVPEPSAASGRTEAIGCSIFVRIRNLFFQYNVSEDQWIKLQSPLLPAIGGSVVQKQGLLYVLGGRHEDQNYQQKPWLLSRLDRQKCKIRATDLHDCIQTYDPLQATWTIEKATIPLPLCCHRAVCVTLQKGS